jgi:ammonia channel protein AmtB
VQFGRQSVLAVAGLVFPFVMTLLILWATDKTVGLRVSASEEVSGLDVGEHAEAAYEWPWETIALDPAGGDAQAPAPLIVRAPGD